MKRNKYRRWKKKELAKKNIGLVHNYSDFHLTEDMLSLLNKGRSFAPTPKNINLTELEAQMDSYDRTMRWIEHFFSDDNNNNSFVEENDENIFKMKKTNLPSQAPSPALNMYLSAVRSDLLGSCNKKTYPNLTPGELKAMEDLKKAQKEGIIQIKPADKGGGWVVASTQDYVSEMKQQLTATFDEGNGNSLPFYEKATENYEKLPDMK